MTTMGELRLGTRGSQLALWQANAVAARIAAAGGPPCRIVTIKTTGDRLQDRPLSEAGGKRLFVKEIEDALLGGEIDLAVHSSKDMPVVLPEGLTIAAVLPATDCVPAPGQGIVAVEIREEDVHTQRAIEAIDDSSAHTALTAERAVVTRLGGGCQTPVGAFATLSDRGEIDLVAVVAALDGSRIVRATGRELQS